MTEKNRRDKKYLDYIKNFVELTAKEESFILSKISYRKYLKNQYILQQGDISNMACFVLSGCIKTFILNPAGQENIIVLAIENWWTADIGSFLYQKPAEFNVQCIEDSEVLQLRFKDLEEIYIEVPVFETFWRKMIEKAYVASQKRIVNGFTLTAKERYLLFKNSYPDIEKRIPQYLVASYLGISKEFLSKIKSQLARGNK